MKINLHHGPFSSFGSPMALNYLPEYWNLPGLILRSMHGVYGVRESFVLRLERDGVEVPSTAVASPWELILEADDGSARAQVAFEDANRLRFTVKGAEMVFASIPAQIQHGFQVAPDTFLVNAPKCGTHYEFRLLKGDMQGRAFHQVRTQDKRKKEDLPGDSWVCVTFSDGSEGTVADYISAPPVPVSAGMEDCLTARQRDWEKWLEHTPEVPPAYKESAERAMYIAWSSTLSPDPKSPLRRDTTLMSKNWMTQCWSWDHCFNAVGHAPGDDTYAWDQWITLFDHQHPNGMLPDSIGSSTVSYSFAKPPIHGWALQIMMQQEGFLTPERTEKAYEVLKKWTDWWMTTRDTNGDGLPEYQHGNDSGWDNGTCFDLAFPVTVPDLPAFLAVQYDTLALLAEHLGQAEDAEEYRAAAQRLVDQTLALHWNGHRLLARTAAGELVETGDSMLPYIFLIAGDRIPSDIRRKLAAGAVRFITPHGAATECPDSPMYVPDGYWRGPIWPSSTTLLVEGLSRSGFPEPAKRIAKGFCDNIVRTQCFAENFNALTGEPLRDRAYTWASGSFLYLAKAYLETNDVPDISVEHSDPLLAVH